MMPVVRGEEETRQLIVLYTVLLVALTLMPVVFGYFGAIYGAAALGLGAAFISLSLRLWREAQRPSALRTYLFSLAYLALLFCAMVLDARL
jgi:protoheme IX farnesyltransferase